MGHLPAGRIHEQLEEPEAACLDPPSPFGPWDGSLRSLRYERLPGLPSRSSRSAKAGGARRDRTADLLHAMQALSQLSYGPVTVGHGLSDQCFRKPWATCGGDPEHSSGSISSLFVTSDVTDNVGDILIAFFLVGDEGRIVVVIVLDGLVDLDVVLGLGNHGLDLAGILLGIGLFQ